MYLLILKLSSDVYINKLITMFSCGKIEAEMKAVCKHLFMDSEPHSNDKSDDYGVVK